MIASAPTPEFLFIPLTKGQFACVDFDAPAEVFRYKWTLIELRNGLRYARRNNRGRSVYLHRVVLGLGACIEQADHKNGNGLDNRRDNLRPCTNTQNQWHIGKRCGGSSRFKGVHRVSDGVPWRARITRHRQVIELGKFTDEEAAARAYDAAAVKYHGEYACLNFPVEAA